MSDWGRIQSVPGGEIVELYQQAKVLWVQAIFNNNSGYNQYLMVTVELYQQAKVLWVQAVFNNNSNSGYNQ